MCAMADEENRPDPDVLSSLPSTRPQRPSARRQAAGSGARKDAAAKGRSGGSDKPAGKPRRKQDTGRPKPKPKPVRPTAARSAAGRRARAGAAGTAGPVSGGRPTAVRPSAATRRAASQREGEPAAPVAPPAGPSDGLQVVATAIQAAGELAQIGLSVGTHALRGALRRIPRP